MYLNPSAFATLSPAGWIVPPIATPSPLPARNTPVRVATFGDSTANLGPLTTDVSLMSTPFHATPGAANSLAGEWSKFAVHQYYPQAWLVGNGGVSGETTTQMLARDNAAPSATRKSVADILDLSPDVVLLRGGSINDIAGTVTPATVDSVVDGVYARHIEIVDRLLAGGVYVIDAGIFGYSGGAAYPDSVREALTKLNGLIATYAASYANPNPRVKYLDFTGTLRDAAGNFLPGISVDGTHLTMTGGALLAQAEAAALEAWFGDSASVRFPGRNLAANPLLAATTVQAWGTVAVAYNLVPTNLNRANAKVETVGGVRMQTTEFTPTAAGSSISAFLPFDPIAMGVAANDVYGVEFDWLLQALDGGGVTSAAPTPTIVYARVDLYKAGAGRAVYEDRTSIPGAFLKPAELRHASMRIQITEPAANLAPGSVILFLFNTNDLRPFKLGVGGLRIVKQ